MLTTKRLNSIEGLSYNNTATLRMPKGLTYHQILLSGGGDLDVTKNIDEIRLILNGKPVSTWRGDELVAMTRFDKRLDPATDNSIVIDFERFGMLTRQARVLTALGTGLGFDAAKNPFPIDTAFLEIDLVTTAANETNPVLSAKARQSPASITGMIKKVRRFSYTAGGVGEFEISDLPKGDLVNRIFFETANAKSLTVERDNYVLFERTATENERFQKDGVRLPQSGFFVFDTTEEGYAGENLATRYPSPDGTRLGERVSDLRFKLDMSAGETFDVIVEYIGPLGN